MQKNVEECFRLLFFSFPVSFPVFIQSLSFVAFLIVVEESQCSIYIFVLLGKKGTGARAACGTKRATLRGL